MTWLQTLFVAVLTAAFCALLSGIVASLSMDWHQVSSLEGRSGYYAIFIALAGLLGGLVLGAVTARVVAAAADPSFGRALTYALLIVAGIASLVAGVTRWMADVPPTLRGQQLMLLVELRWPKTQRISPAEGAVAHVLELGTLSGGTLRRSKQGPLWMQDARLQEGHWIVPGAVEVATNRGQRIVTVEPGIAGAHGLLLPMNGSPSTKHLDWSEWMPLARPGEAAIADQFSLRFRVVPRNEPSRTETVGSFQVGTIAQSFFVDGWSIGQPVVEAKAQFAVWHQGQPVIIDAGGDLKDIARDRVTSVNEKALATTTNRMQAVATLPGLPSALLVRVELPGHPAACRLLEDVGNGVRITPVSQCDDLLHAQPLTNDQAWRDAARSIRKVPGQIDRETFMRAGTYLFSEAIFDSGERTVRRIAPMVYANGFNAGVAPLGISPDGRSIVRAGFSETERGAPALLVFNTEAQTPYLVAIDPLATRYAGSDALDITWLAHYYHWQRGADGQDRLAARTAVKPLPYRGVLSTQSNGSVVYHLQPSGQAMCDVLAEFLRTQFHAQRVTKDELALGYKMSIGDVEVHVFVNKSEHQVALFLENSSDKTLVPRIAERFNAALATGLYDHLFGR